MRRENKLKRYLLLSGKRIFFIIILWFVAVIFHNLFYALSELSKKNFEIIGTFFFLVANLLIPIYLAAGFIYTSIWMILNKKYPGRRFYIKFGVSIIIGLIITFILIAIDFLNDMYLIPILVFTLLIFGLISLFQKNKK